MKTDWDKEDYETIEGMRNELLKTMQRKNVWSYVAIECAREIEFAQRQGLTEEGAYRLLEWVKRSLVFDQNPLNLSEVHDAATKVAKEGGY